MAMGTDDAHLQLLTQKLDQGENSAMALQEASDPGDVWLDWFIFSDFDRYFGMVDSQVDAGGDGGGGGEGGGDGGGGE